jgi:hypothetical protein
VKQVIRPACTLLGTTRVLETENMKAILSILTAIISNQSSISHLLSLSLQNVVYNEDIGKKITEILKANKIQNIYLNGCEIGKSEWNIESLIEGIF